MDDDQSDRSGWAEPVDRLETGEVGPHALNLNVAGRAAVGGDAGGLAACGASGTASR